MFINKIIVVNYNFSEVDLCMCTLFIVAIFECQLSNGNGRYFLNEYKGVPNNITAEGSIAGQVNFFITDICIQICCFVDIRRLVKFSL